MKRVWIGIDPARAGAITVLTASPTGGAVALLVVAWKKATRGRKPVFLVDVWRHTKPKKKTQRVVGFAARISVVVIDHLVDLLAEMEVVTDNIVFSISTEDAYIGRSAKTGLSVARFGGQVAGVLEAHLRTESLWIRAAEWRKAVLTLGHFTKREQAKKASLAYIPPLVENLREAIIVLGDLDHITDSAGVALWHKDHYLK